jgi:hypothetical protein
MTKGQRISRLVAQLEGETPGEASTDISHHPFYRGFFRCWNEQRYYEAHDVLEQLWLKTKNEDANYFKGLIQAAGAFVHLQKQFQHPSHAKHGRRLQPATRLFRLAHGNLTPFVPVRHSFDVAGFCDLLGEYADRILASEYRTNPWSPSSAPKLRLISERAIQPSSGRGVR